ncbi:MAG: hypothetical protein RRY34_10415 [Victivallaceae bacterium]
MTKKTKITLIVTPIIIIIGVCTYFIYGLVQAADKLLAWEDLHVVVGNYIEHFYKHPELGADFNEEEREITSVVTENRANLPKLDRWGTPMRFFMVKRNDDFYCKGISAGKDRKFFTSDDIIDSEYDDTGNVIKNGFVGAEKK